MPKSGSGSSSSSRPAVFYRADGGVDRRCSAARSGAIQFTSSGAVDGRSSAVRSQDVLLTNDGNVDGRSSFARSPAPSQSPSRVITTVDGTIDGRCQAVRNGDVILRDDGKIDGRSAAVRSGDVRLTSQGNPALNSSSDIRVPEGERYIGYTSDYRQMFSEIKRDNPSLSDSKIADYCEYKLTGKVNSDLLRSPYQQSVYRDNSRSEYKEDKDAAHKLSLEVIAPILESKPGPRFSLETIQEISRAVNGQDCFRMVLQHTNRSEHRLLDGAIITKSSTGEMLTKAESERARIAYGAFTSMSDQLPGSMKGATESFFNRLNLCDGGDSSPSPSSLTTEVASLSLSPAPQGPSPSP